MAVKRPTLVHSPHPLTAVGRQVIYEAHRRNETLGGYLRRLRIEVDRGPLAVCVNGRPLPNWQCYRLRRGDFVEVRAVVAGGGGAGKVLRSVAMIAVMVAAAYVAGPAGAAFFGSSGMATVAGSAIMIGGSMLVNALLPPPMPDIAGVGGRGDANISQNYALSGARNRARTYAPMPLVIGQRRFVPDAGGNPFTEFAGQDQYLYQVYHFGLQPDLQLTDYRIGNTPIGAYQGVELIAAGGDGRLPGVFANVDTDTGREVKNSDGWVVRQLARDTVGIGMDLQGVAYYANDKGGMDWRNVDSEIQFRRVPDGPWQPYGGDQYGKYRLAGNSITPVRQTLRQDLPAAQYEIRVRKTSGDISSSRERNDFALAGLRAYRQDSTNYVGQRRIGLKIRASSQLNGAVDELSAMAVASCQVWTGSGWATSATTNPAWWYLWFALGGFDAQGRRTYGAGLPISRIDIDAIKVWAAWCDAKKLSVGLVLDRAYSIADVLTMIARCGRARYTWQTGKLGVIWDAADLPVVAVFGPANIRAGSFRIEYTTEQTADEVVVNFSNPAKGFELDQVRVAVPGVIAPTNPVTLDFVGCCDVSMAGREANLIAASQLYHRRRVSWETDFEGLVATRGDVVLLSHDLASWAYSGRLLAGSRGQLQLDRAVPLGASGWVGIRFPDGRYATYRVKTGSGDSDTLQLRDLIPASDAGGPLPVPDESADSVPYDWMWFYDNGTQPGRRVKIVDVKPSGDGVKFTAIDDNPSYYAAESGDFSSGGQAPSLPPALGFLRLSESSRVTGDGRRVAVVTAVWPPLRGAINYQLKYRRAGGAWQAAVVPDTSYSWDADPQDLEVSVSAVFADGTISAPAVASLTIKGHATPPPVATAFTATGEMMQITLRWSYPDRADLRGAQLFASTDGNTWVKLADIAYPAAVYTHLGLMAGAVVQYQLRIVDSWGNVGEAVTTRAEAVRNVDLLLEQLKNSLTSAQLQESLRTPIEQAVGVQGSVNSLIQAQMQQMLTADEIRSTQGNHYAFAKRQLSTLGDAISQEANERVLLAAKVKDNAAGIIEESKSRVREDGALSERIGTMQTTVGNHTASLQEVGRTVDGVMAEKIIKLNASGKIAGIGLRTDQNGSAVDFLADRFVVSQPDGNGSRQVFIVSSINGRPALGLAGDLIADGSLIGRRVLVDGSVDAGQINSRGLTIRDMDGNVVVDMSGMGAGYIKGLLAVGQIDTRGLTIRDSQGSVIVSANGIDGSYVRNLMVDTLQIRGEAVSKNDTRTVTLSGWQAAGWSYSFPFYCSDRGTLLVFGDAPFPSITLRARGRAVGISNGSGVLVLDVSAGETVTVGVDSVGGYNASGQVRYGAVLYRR
ncbi:host specificity factor TipJ family phage tail protein [Chromobacterium sp. TRC.1.1.SA]|uniref:Host specificity factor TipJ family phage tail protein n=1 Tax=Chromobacterium indicum TaxID=3110228 RepID=A0ABV0CD80_9NEIS